MPIKTSGPLSFSEIQAEFGGANPISLSEYYAGAGLVPAGTSGINGPIPSSGAISTSQFYGAQNFIARFTETRNLSGTENTAARAYIDVLINGEVFFYSTVSPQSKLGGLEPGATQPNRWYTGASPPANSEIGFTINPTGDGGAGDVTIMPIVAGQFPTRIVTVGRTTVTESVIVPSGGVRFEFEDSTSQSDITYTGTFRAKYPGFPDDTIPLQITVLGG